MYFNWSHVLDAHLACLVQQSTRTSNRSRKPRALGEKVKRVKLELCQIPPRSLPGRIQSPHGQASSIRFQSVRVRWLSQGQDQVTTLSLNWTQLDSSLDQIAPLLQGRNRAWAGYPLDWPQVWTVGWVLEPRPWIPAVLQGVQQSVATPCSNQHRSGHTALRTRCGPAVVLTGRSVRCGAGPSPSPGSSGMVVGPFPVPFISLIVWGKLMEIDPSLEGADKVINKR